MFLAVTVTITKMFSTEAVVVINVFAVTVKKFSPAVTVTVTVEKTFSGSDGDGEK